MPRRLRRAGSYRGGEDRSLSPEDFQSFVWVPLVYGAVGGKTWKSEAWAPPYVGRRGSQRNSHEIFHIRAGQPRGKSPV